MENCLANARLLSNALEKTGWYVCVSDVHRKKGEHIYMGKEAVEYGEEGETSEGYNAGLPVVAFRLSDEFKKDYGHVKQESVSNLLRAKQFIVPSASFPLSLLFPISPLPFLTLPLTNTNKQTTPSPPTATPPRSSASSSARAYPSTYSTGSSPTSSPSPSSS